jgi:hypothetical protein
MSQLKNVFDKLKKVINKRVPEPDLIPRYENYGLWAQQQKFYEKGYNEGVQATRKVFTEQIERIQKDSENLEGAG